MTGMAGRTLAAAVSVALAACLARGQAPAGRGAIHERVSVAVAKAARFLAAQIDQEGKCKGEFPEKDPRYGGKTAVCAYGLVTALKDHKHGAVQRAMRWLAGAKLHGTYAVAMRACALAAWKDAKAVPLLQRDVRWLIRAAGSRALGALEGVLNYCFPKSLILYAEKAESGPMRPTSAR